jgi:DNA-directed RNA polymerase specialized sigma24 family protein
LDDDVTFEDSLEDEEDFTQILDNEYTYEKIQQAMYELDEMSKEIISLKYIEDKSYGEIAGIL